MQNFWNNGKFFGIFLYAWKHDDFFNVSSWFKCIDMIIFFAKILSRLTKACGQNERNALSYITDNAVNP